MIALLTLNGNQYGKICFEEFLFIQNKKSGKFLILKGVFDKYYYDIQEIFDNDLRFDVDIVDNIDDKKKLFTLKICEYEEEITNLIHGDYNIVTQYDIAFKVHGVTEKRMS